MKLVIGTKRYSSWSLRPWILMRYFHVPFEEQLIAFDMKPGSRENTDAVQARMSAVSPNGRVPVLLLDDGNAINESLSICEYVNEAWLDGRAWPRSEPWRSAARSMCLEMATGFLEMWRLLPMSIGSMTAQKAVLPAKVDKDVARVIAMLDLALGGGDAEFLFGSFGIADAYFLPVLFRFETYRVPLSPALRAYSDRMMALPAVAEWRNDLDDTPSIEGIANIVRHYPIEVADACKI